MRFSERMIMLQILDQQWKDHLLSMDHLKEGIGLRGYGQKDPLVEYKRESFHIFQQMMSTFEEETLKILFHLRVSPPPESAPSEPPPAERVPARRAPAMRQANGSPPSVTARTPASSNSIDAYTRVARRKNRQQLAQARMAGAGGGGVAVKQVVRGKKIGRNKPCPCGSGRKYKRCHGKVA